MVSGTGALLKWASNLLSLKSYRALVNPSVERSETTYFSKFEFLKVTILAAGPDLTPIYSANLYPNPEFTVEIEKTKPSSLLFLANS